MKKKVVVIGNFNIGQNVYNGQTVKTRDYYYYLCERFGNENVDIVDTAGWSSRVVKVWFEIIRSCRGSENVVLMLGVNGARIIVPFVVLLKHFFRFKVFFPIVGGALMYEFDKHRMLKKGFSKIDSVYFETKTMENHFLNLGYKNVFYAPVFTRRHAIREVNIDNAISMPLKLCTYSRVCKEKGISLAIDAVRNINKQYAKVVCTLDIYGVPYEEYKQEFEEKLEECKGFVNSKPYLDGENTIDTLSEYAAMLFPTYYEGEGFPIAIVECMHAGVPVIASDWHYNSEIVQDGKTGYIFSLEEDYSLEKKIDMIISNFVKLRELKENCLENAKRFKPEVVMNDLFCKIEGNKVEREMM